VKATNGDARTSGKPRQSAATSQDMRERIIEAAVMVFHEHGYERARSADIATSSGIFAEPEQGRSRHDGLAGTIDRANRGYIRPGEIIRPRSNAMALRSPCRRR
jgi:Bacterial regulatory proteins, tetR family